jgi:LPXTG-motif cell wall-anchored protein
MTLSPSARYAIHYRNRLAEQGQKTTATAEVGRAVRIALGIQPAPAVERSIAPARSTPEAGASTTTIALVGGGVLVALGAVWLAVRR